MWDLRFKAYVDRHLHFYYGIPAHIKIAHGTPERSEQRLSISNTGRGFFEQSVSEPWWLKENDLPILFKEENQALFVNKEDKLFITADLYSGIFYLLSGIQELSNTDNSDRFNRAQSWQGRNGFEKLALVDAYFDLIVEGINRAYNTHFSYQQSLPSGIFLSHDIDRLRSGRTEGVFNMLKAGKLSKALKGLLAKKDPWDNLEEIALLERSYGVSSTFFMLPESGKHSLGINADYNIKNSTVQASIHRLREMEMEVALHGSLGSHLSIDQLMNEKERVGGEIEGNRFHFLKFNTSVSTQNLSEADLKYDCSMGFPDSIGFRRGTTRPFKLFDWQKTIISDVVEIPLHAMDTTLQHPKYLGLKPTEALFAINDLFQVIKKHQGVFSLLWHNNYFSDYKYGGWKEVYEAFLKDNGSESFYTAKTLANSFSAI